MPSPDEDFYQDRILDHYEDPYHRGHCQHATHQHSGKNPLCGDVVQIEMAIGPDGKLNELYFQGDGCCVSQASASMLVERMDGKTVEEIKSFSAQDMLDLYGPKLTPNRQKCCLLSWRVMQTTVHSPIHDGDKPQEEIIT